MMLLTINIIIVTVITVIVFVIIIFVLLLLLLPLLLLYGNSTIHVLQHELNQLNLDSKFRALRRIESCTLTILSKTLDAKLK